MAKEIKPNIGKPVGVKVKHISGFTLFIIVLVIAASILGFVALLKNNSYFAKNYQRLMNGGNIEHQEDVQGEKSLIELASSDNIEDCDLLEGGEQKICRVSVSENVASNADDPSVCDQYPDVAQKCKDNYYRKKARETKDKKYCDLISQNQRDGCYIELKILTGDKSYCDYISNSKVKEMCSA